MRMTLATDRNTGVCWFRNKHLTVLLCIWPLFDADTVKCMLRCLQIIVGGRRSKKTVVVGLTLGVQCKYEFCHM